MEILLLLFIYFFNYIKSKSNTRNIKNKLGYNNTRIKRHLTTINENQKLFFIINIYNQYSKVSYISSQNNKNGDLYIATNSGERFEDKRLIYALKSDGTNYFSNNKESYKIYNVTLDIIKNDYNTYPIITPLIINY